jgi:hypothetical protein
MSVVWLQLFMSYNILLLRAQKSLATCQRRQKTPMITSQRTFRATTFGETPSPSDWFTELAGLSLSRRRIVLKLLADERHTKNVLESTGNMNYDLSTHRINCASTFLNLSCTTSKWFLIQHSRFLMQWFHDSECTISKSFLIQHSRFGRAEAGPEWPVLVWINKFHRIS